MLGIPLSHTDRILHVFETFDDCFGKQSIWKWAKTSGDGSFEFPTYLTNIVEVRMEYELIWIIICEVRRTDCSSGARSLP